MDGKLPEGARRLANQVWEIPLIEKIVARLAIDAKNPHLVRVGVIDNGVDIAHPDLVDKIDFGVSGNRLISAGHDVMGADRIPSPQILRYEYYAFGAEAIENGKIKGPPADPFKKLKEYDRAFLDQFIPKLQANPALKGTIWSRYTKDNFSLIGAHRFVNTDFDRKTYRRMKETNPEDLFRLDWKPSAQSSVADLSEAFSFQYPVIFGELDLGANGWPRPQGGGIASAMFQPEMSLMLFDQADVFYDLVKSEFEAFAKTSGYQKDFDHLVEFMTPRLFDVSDSPRTRVGNSLGKLEDVIYYERKGYGGYDQFRDFRDGLYSAATQQKLLASKAWPTAAVVPTADDLKAAVKNAVDTGSSMTAWMIKNPARFEAEEIEDAKRFQKRIKAWVVLLEEYLNRKGWDPKTFGDVSPADPAIQSSYRRYLVKTKHPLLDPASIDQSHGSHVSGIIAKQNENIRIVPLRVITESTKNSPVKDPVLFAEFKKGFAEWLREPLVLRALEGRFSPLLGGKKGAELISAIELVFDKQMVKGFENSKLDFRFLGEVEQAIELAGKEKLKLVNISLGTTFNREVIDYRNLSAVKTVEQYFEFLRFEYLKWKISKTVREKAPKTLFLVANGNDGAWLDGRTRSAVPVDLSSAFLADYEDASKGFLAPNNHLKNVLGVGSLSQVDELSSFSNILISKVPQVFAHGEAVLSPVRPLADDAMKRLYQERVSPMFMNFSFGLIEEEATDPTNRFYPYWVEKYDLKGTPEEIKNRIRELQGLSDAGLGALEKSESAMATDFFLQFPMLRRTMSGTSMATPTMTGMLANMIEKDLKARGISPSALYDHPDYAPQKLIETVLAKADPVYKDATVIDLKKWTGEVLWAKSKAEEMFELKIKNAEKAEPKVLSDRTSRKSMGYRNCAGLFRKR